MDDRFSRTEMLLGADAMGALSSSRVIVFGVGGVGGYVVEALARSGVGAIDVVDNDRVSLSNINRQIIATSDTVGRYKTEVIKERILSINPECKVTEFRMFYLPETASEIDLSVYDYVVDAIDTVSGKLEIIANAKKAGVPVISAMGAGNKLDPTAFEITDLEKTSGCPLARVMRTECRKRGLKGITVVYSKEKALKPISPIAPETDSKKVPPGSVAFVPSVLGLVLASYVIKTLIPENKQE